MGASKHLFGKNCNRIANKPISIQETLDKIKTNKIENNNNNINKKPNYNKNTNFNKSQNSIDKNEKKDILAFQKLIDKNEELGDFIFHILTLLNNYFNSVFKILFSKNFPDNFFIEKSKEEFNKIVKDKNIIIKNEYSIKNVKFNDEITRNNLKALADIINVSTEQDYYTNMFSKMLQELKNNKKCKNIFEENLNFEFIIFPEILNTDFYTIFENLKELRHYINHKNINRNFTLTKTLNAFFLLLPHQIINLIYDKFTSILTEKDYNNYNLYNEFNKNSTQYKSLYNDFKNKKSEKIKELYSVLLSKNKAREDVKDLKNNEQNKILISRFRQRKRILTGEIKYRLLPWRQCYEKYKSNHTSYFNNKNIYKITTFKEIYNFISGKNIFKIEKAFNDIFDSRKTKVKKEKPLIQFKYIEDFYFTNIKINFLLLKFINIIKNKKPFLLDKSDKEKDAELIHIRNCLAHNKLFYFIEYEENISSDYIINKIGTILEDFKNETKNNKKINYHNVFFLSYRKLIFDLKTPYIFNQDGNSIKVSNSAILRKFLKHKNKYIIDNKIYLVLLANKMMFKNKPKKLLSFKK